MIIRGSQDFAQNGDMKIARILLGNGRMREIKTGHMQLVCFCKVFPSLGTNSKIFKVGIR